ncbi:MAG: SGNH/GDSL hydrolase family protein [Bacteroidales bacterium]|nr:SGNH/GDSL hydrolase family protein [Candidatus Cryptobacteroides caccocaballi]
MKKTTVIVAGLAIIAAAVVAIAKVADMRKDNPEDENPIGTIKETPGLTAIFRSWGFIGDSLCSGEMECYAPGTDHVSYNDMYEYSWGMQLARLCGAEGYCYSQGGQTAKAWLETENSRTWAEARLTPKQAYVIALGVNDFYQYELGNLQMGDLSTDVDMEDYKRNADTFAGQMAGIVQRVKSIQKEAKIFVVTRPRGEEGPISYECFNDIVRGLSDFFSDVYVIDLYRYAWDYGTAEHVVANKLNGHLSAAGYLQTAYMFCTYIDWIIRHNPEDFKNVPLIGTGYMKYPDENNSAESNNEN